VLRAELVATAVEVAGKILDGTNIRPRCTL